MANNAIFDRTGWRAELGHRLALARKQRGLTQEALAVEAGIGRSSLANIEVGRTAVAADQLWRIAIVLGISVGHLMPERVNA